jgi:hypothetical protein
VTRILAWGLADERGALLLGASLLTAVFRAFFVLVCGCSIVILRFVEDYSMAHKYGLFNGAVQQPAQTFEGDKMMQSGDYVFIYRKEPGAAGNIAKDVQVAAIKLAEGQCVKEVS